MPVSNTFNYSPIIIQAFHATPTTIVLREAPGIYNSQQRFPRVADVRTGTVYGPGQFEQQGYQTGTLSPSGGGGTVVYPVMS